jgi:hypothetical protein
MITPFDERGWFDGPAEETEKGCYDGVMRCYECYHVLWCMARLVRRACRRHEKGNLLCNALIVFLAIWLVNFVWCVYGLSNFVFCGRFVSEHHKPL